MKWRSLQESDVAVDGRSLREQLIERKELMAKYVPAEMQAVHARVIADLKADGIEERVLQPGSKAPDFQLQDQHGKLISRTDIPGTGKLVICFFRGRWCPFCVAQLEAMQQVLPQIRAAGANLAGISPQIVQQNFFMADQHRLAFPLLSDSRNEVARQFGLVYRVPEDQKAIYRRAFVNLPFVNGDESWELAIPAAYILDRDGQVLFASANADYTVRPEPADILHFLKSA
jgi:peroxiredoxin